jgi:hypothetical protein
MGWREGWDEESERSYPERLAWWEANLRRERRFEIMRWLFVALMVTLLFLSVLYLGGWVDGYRHV